MNTIDPPRWLPRTDDPRFHWDIWAITPTLAAAIGERLDVLRPASILEMGSGISTVFLAAYAEHVGAKLVSLEHSPEYYGRTAQLLVRFELRDRVDLRLAPLIPQAGPDGGVYPFYDTQLNAPIDFVLVDGPPEKIGRQATFFAAYDLLAPGWELWLDDGNRDHERACVRLWQSQFTFDATLHQLPDSRGSRDRGHWRLRAPSLPTAQ